MTEWTSKNETTNQTLSEFSGARNKYFETMVTCCWEEDEVKEKVTFVKNNIKYVFKMVVSSVCCLIVLLVLYSFLGAWIFLLIESPHEVYYKHNITRQRKEIIQTLANLPKADDSTEWEATAQELLLQYELSVTDAYKNDVGGASNEHTWNLWSSLFFCATIYTTIGYGNISPATDIGKGFTIIYALFGIPLSLVIVSMLSTRLTNILKCIWGKLIRHERKGAFDIRPNTEKAENDISFGEQENEQSETLCCCCLVENDIQLPVLFPVILLIVYSIIGSTVYSVWEDWTFFEAFYFIFISLTTIGFGDIVPEDTYFFIISSIYVFVGLALEVVCMQTIMDKLNNQAREAMRKVKYGSKSNKKRKRPSRF